MSYLLNSIIAHEKKHPIIISSLYMTVSSFFYACVYSGFKILERFNESSIVIQRSPLLYFINLWLLTKSQGNIYKLEDKKMFEGFKIMLRIGILGGLFLLTAIYSYQHLPVSITTVIIQSQCLLVALYSTIFTKEDQMNKSLLISLLTGLIGVIFIVDPDLILQYFGGTQQLLKFRFVDLTIAFVAQIILAIVMLQTKQMKGKGSQIEIFQLSLVCQNLVMGLLCIVHQDFKLIQPESILEIILLTINGIFALTASQIYSRAMITGNVNQNSILSQLQVPFTLLIDIFFFNEQLTLINVFGIFLVAFSGILITITKKK